MFWRKMLIVIAAIVGVATGFAPTDALARGVRGGRGGGRGFVRGRGRGVGWGVGVGAIGVGVAATCWRSVYVNTPYGPRWRRVWICN
jgi:hypothetical protein